MNISRNYGNTFSFFLFITSLFLFDFLWNHHVNTYIHDNVVLETKLIYFSSNYTNYNTFLKYVIFHTTRYFLITSQNIFYYILNCFVDELYKTMVVVKYLLWLNKEIFNWEIHQFDVENIFADDERKQEVWRKAKIRFTSEWVYITSEVN